MSLRKKQTFRIKRPILEKILEIAPNCFPKCFCGSVCVLGVEVGGQGEVSLSYHFSYAYILVVIMLCISFVYGHP